MNGLTAKSSPTAGPEERNRWLPDWRIEGVALGLFLQHEHPYRRRSVKTVCSRCFKGGHLAFVGLALHFERIDDIPRVPAVHRGLFVLPHTGGLSLYRAAMAEGIEH